MAHQFDELAKALAGGISRREALRRVGTGIAATLLASLRLDRAWAGCRSGTFLCPSGTCCPNGTVCCGTRCCLSNQYCVSGTCSPCPAGKFLCGQSCCSNGSSCCGGTTCCPVTQACCDFGVCCGPGQACRYGQCTPVGVLCGGVRCAVGEACCNGRCTRLNTSTNCGACGDACDPNELCTNGVCHSVCQVGRIACLTAGYRAWCCPGGSTCGSTPFTCA
jgi:hypothetical protein